MKIKTSFLVLLTFFITSFSAVSAQQGIRFGANLESGLRYFTYDSSFYSEEDIASGNVPKQVLLLEQNEELGLPTNFVDRIAFETWLDVGVYSKYVDVTTRWDWFRTSNLRDPLAKLTNAGLGHANVKLKYKFVELQGGTIYEQFGNGLAFRSYEERAQGIDNALLGGMIRISPGEKFLFKALYGRIKEQVKDDNEIGDGRLIPSSTPEIQIPLNTYDTLVYGANIEVYPAIGNFIMTHGISYVANLLSMNDIRNIQTTVNVFPNPFKVPDTYHVFSYYNQLNIGDNLSIGLDYNYKTQGAVPVFDFVAGVQEGFEFKLDDGYAFLANLSYSKNNLGAVLQYRILRSFNFRTLPDATNNDGYIGFLPSLSKFYTYRLQSRYLPSAFPDNEQGLNTEIYYSLSKKSKFSLTYSYINTLYSSERENRYIRLYRDIYLENETKINKKISTVVGVQHIRYNQKLLQSEGDFVDALIYNLVGKFKISKYFSNNTEVSQMFTPDDFGSWFWVQSEFTYKNASLSIGDMFNYGNPDTSRRLHYYNFYFSYLFPKNISLEVAYVRQPETIICSGGICRVEPAFAGARIGFKMNY